METMRVELVPPGQWRTLFFRGWRQNTAGGGAFFNWSHWAVGFEISSRTVTVMLGPVALAVGRTRQA